MTGRFLAAILRRPSFLAALLRLRGNAVGAAEAAAAAVVAAVAAIAPIPS
jgi:hypothetical protein